MHHRQESEERPIHPQLTNKERLLSEVGNICISSKSHDNRKNHISRESSPPRRETYNRMLFLPLH